MGKETRKISRRSFLKATGAVTGAAVLAGCGKNTSGVQVKEGTNNEVVEVVSESTINQTLVPTQCPYCGFGCGSYWVVENGKIIGSRPDKDHPDNKGQQCVKGLNAYQVFENMDVRLTKPLIRRDPSTKGTFNGFEEVSWEEALDVVATKFADIKKNYGGNSIGFYGSGQLTLEAQYLINKFWKAGLESNTIEANARMCMTSAVVGYSKAFGSDAPPTTYEDLYLADLIIDIGHNMRAAHSVEYWLISSEKKRRKLETYVIDPRETGTARGWKEIDPEHSHYWALRPNGDLALLNSLGYVFIYELDAVDKAFVEKNTEGFEAYKEGVKKYKPEDVADITGISPDQVRELAKKWVNAKNGVLTIWSMGVNQRTIGVPIVEAIINLHLITGTMGKPGFGPFSMTGQPNAMGERLSGGLTGKLPGNRALKNPDHVKAVERVWGEGTLAKTVKMKNPNGAVGMFERALAGDVKAIFFSYTTHINLPDVNNLVRPALKNMFVVASDIFKDAPNLLYADVVFPAATIGEVQGTYINSIRRIYVVDKAVEPPEGTKPDMDIMIDLAHKMKEKDSFWSFWSKQWNYSKDDKGFYNAEEVFQEFKDILKGSDADITGIEGYEQLRKLKGIQWPAPTPEIAAKGGTKRRYMGQEEGWADKPYGNFPSKNGKAKIIFVDQGVYTAADGSKWGDNAPEFPDVEFARVPLSEVPTDKYPVWLALGIVYEHFHSSKTIRSRTLKKLVPEMYVEVNEEDAKVWGINDGDWIKVSTRRGSITAKASVGPNSKIGVRGRNLPPRGEIFAPWNLSVADSPLPSENKWLVNTMPSRATDPESGQAGFKHMAARIEKV
ncbi:molybdopterin-dependent oxidoreductase [Microaerobacter geothermalis]|uniref:molybdopterin-dependent oxidoreductase n=1 Tax=Microaerobacter geothermalis TaxID=674972 RepID=UPI001F22EF29|nr:molybdopterin-dependent oxidoreductase [Microaerobacter geothermalis]MCF6092649.1 molybdopterin-dependent oxidoreductase [Microaerobacter geothermalis]